MSRRNENHLNANNDYLSDDKQSVTTRSACIRIFIPKDMFCTFFVFFSFTSLKVSFFKSES